MKEDRLDWNMVEELSAQLARKISSSFNPEVIVGISRGGVIPARLLSTRLGVKDMHFLTVRKSAGGRKVVTDITERLEGKRVLLVEDMLETGESLAAAKKYLEERKAMVKTACFFTTPKTIAAPDYFLERAPGKVTFPWE